MELPPRARRILLSSDLRSSPAGTTSACAENTSLSPTRQLHAWNYLRVRGEYAVRAPPTPVAMELPPRARRIPFAFKVKTNIFGTTSACAENTFPQFCPTLDTWNYLRVRGEYGHAGREGFPQAELPPRARRILQHFRRPRAYTGTTSACAENTYSRSNHPAFSKNYLRVRGEYWCLP